MNSKNYNQIAKNISQELNDYFNSFCDDFPRYNSIRNDYTKKSIHLNGVQFYAGFISGKSNNWKEFINIAIAIEMTMLWAYKTNRILDEKQDVFRDKEKIKSTMLEHDLTLACIYQLIDNHEKKSPSFSHAHILIEEILSRLSFGFLFEKERLNINHSSLEKILLDWEDKYIRRNNDFNLVYDLAPLIGYSLSSSNFDIIKEYNNSIPAKLRFSNLGQIINDLGDFGEDIDINVKTYQDIFSDIRNGIITLPARRLISEEHIAKALKKPNITFSKSWQKKARKLILDSGINEEIIQLAEKSFKKHNDFFNSNIQNPDPLLLKSFGMLVNNKYFNQKIVFESGLSLRNRVVLCDINGKETGTYDKLLAHKEGKMHKAFSIFVFNGKGELLIQQRAKNKYHSGGLWSNSCCSHAISGEPAMVTAKRRLKEELGFDCDLKKKFSFAYNISVGGGNLVENEFDVIFFGKYDGEIYPNPEEVQDVKWINLEDLTNDIKLNPNMYSPWFKIIQERMGYR